MVAALAARVNVVRLGVTNFRNLEEVTLRPALDGLTVVRGLNGAGKTSLLEALAYCSTLRSFRGVPREALVSTGAQRANVACEVVVDSRRVDIAVDIELGHRDRVTKNGRRVDSGREMLHSLRTTLFTPDDLAIVKEGPAGRRDLIDEAIEATWPRMAAEKRSLDRVLRHRNALLRQAGARLDADALHTLDVWDEQLAESGERVASAREAVVGELAPAADEAFASLAPSAGPLRLRYVRSFEGDLRSAIARARHDDLRRQVTTVGPQRDDLEIEAGGLDARTRLSQGRQRATALALKLSTHRLVASKTGATPVLLLDDAFSELDERTAAALMAELPVGQALLTTAGSLPPGARADTEVLLADGRIA